MSIWPFATWRLRCFWCARTCVSLTLFLSAAPGFASTPSETLGHYQQTVFDQSQGAPGGIGYLAQTSDGFLWLNGDKGLMRFDGVHFLPFKPLPGERLAGDEIGALFPAQGGGLWMAYENGAPILLKNGHLVYFGKGQGYVGNLGTFFADHQGTVWAITHTAIMYFKQGAWHVVHRAPSAADSFYGGAFDARDNLWVTEKHHGLLVKRAGSTDFTELLDWGDDGALVTVGPSGRIYLQTQEHGCQIYRDQGTTLVEVTAPIPGWMISVLETGSGGLWLTTLKGSAYYSSPAALALAEKGHATPKLVSVPGTGEFPWPLLEDRDGNVWLGRSVALDRFSPAAFNTLALPLNAHEISPSVDRSGGIWLGSENFPVAHLAAGESSWEGTQVSSFTLATYTDPFDDTVWGANPMGVWQLSPGMPRLVAPFAKAMKAGAVFSVLRDHRGTLFISTYDWHTGIFEWDGKSWSNALGRPEIIKMMAVDSRNHLWLSSRKSNHLTELSNGVEQSWDERQNLHVGMVRSIFAADNQLWVGGDDGVQFFDGKRFTSLLALDPGAFQTVTGLVMDRFGSLWLQNLDGVLRIPAAEIRKALAQPNYHVSYQSFGSSDGTPGAPDVNRTLPSLRLGSDGRIWAHSTAGLAWIDPAQWLKSVALPPLVVESVFSSKDTFSASAGAITLAHRQDSFRISYTIPALTHSERVRFSYRLAGFSDWTYAGTRREAVFTNVPPGHFRFEVRAFSGYGVASVTSAPLTLIRLPAWYQTWWLRTLVLLLLLLLLWLAFALRMRGLHRRRQIRVDERERIARDLHDTLLQDVQGIQLRLQTWAADKSIEPRRRDEMSAVAINARDMLIDGRDRIIALRAADAKQGDLGTELRAIGEDYASLYAPQFVHMVQGDPRLLVPDVAAEVLDIVREALRNAFVHSTACRVGLTIEWQRVALVLRVCDDGCGIDETVMREGGRPGHWGLRGMRERAAKIGAKLVLTARPDGGTEMLLAVPAGLVYAGAHSRLWHRIRNGWQHRAE